jgi:predicted GNAT superfamily acetyltransferase
LIIRDVGEADYDTLLRLNLESEHFLSPLSLPRLESLCAQAWYCRVIALEDAVQRYLVQGFIIVLREGAEYDSPNYQWFSRRYAKFLYIDRVVIAAAARGRHLARHLYDDLFARARSHGFTRITCEFDTDPPNEASRAFHERLGFREVGAQRVGAAQKAVSMQEAILSSHP